MPKQNSIAIESENVGSINIHGSVFISIVNKVLSESKGIKVGDKFFEKLKQKIVINITDDLVVIDIPLTVVYGNHIPTIAKEIQKNITEEILMLLDFKKVIINISVDEIVLEDSTLK